jgi:hypothetical protein
VSNMTTRSFSDWVVVIGLVLLEMSSGECVRQGADV